MKIIVETVGPKGYGTYEASKQNQHIELTPSKGRPEGILCPGFIDVHIHGGYGVDFMESNPDDLCVLCSKLSDCGYEGFLATTVTSDVDKVQKSIKNVESYLQEPPCKPNSAKILGFHLEGPFISECFPGAQPKEEISDIEINNKKWMNILTNPLLKLITLAPEKEGALALISKLSKKGVVVSMGHSDATYEEASKAYSAGASHATHTFNAMRRFHHREAGLTGFVLLAPKLSAELIYDRVHVSKEAAQLLLNCKTNERVVAISDGTMASGMMPGKEIEMWGQKCYIAENRVCLSDRKTLAGSTITLLDAFRNLAIDFGYETAIRLCSLNPRKILNMQDNPEMWLLFDYRLGLKEIFRKERATVA